MTCTYCDRKCDCGGIRKQVGGVKGNKDGEIILQCMKCKNKWHHWHRGGKGHGRSPGGGYE